MFGPDGYLYIGMGDGGSGDDPFNNAQNPNTLLGKMLRINVAVPDSDPEGYDLPASNPFLSGSPISAMGEIWAFGLRNPSKFSFDDPARGGTGAMLIGDVGHDFRLHHAISDEAGSAAVQGRWEDFIKLRLRTLEEMEESFVAGIVNRHPEVQYAAVLFR